MSEAAVAIAASLYIYVFEMYTLGDEEGYLSCDFWVSDGQSWTREQLLLHRDPLVPQRLAPLAYVSLVTMVIGALVSWGQTSFKDSERILNKTTCTTFVLFKMRESNFKQNYLSSPCSLYKSY